MMHDLHVFIQFSLEVMWKKKNMAFYTESSFLHKSPLMTIRPNTDMSLGLYFPTFS